MKILYHHRVAARDGMDVHITELIRAFQALGHEVRVVGPDRGDDTHFGKSGTFVSRIRQMLPQVVGECLELVYDRLAYRRLKKAYLEFEPDVLYERHNLFLTAGKRLHEKFGVPYLLEVNSPLAEERAAHGGLSLQTLARAQEARVWRSASHVFPVTQVLAEMLVGKGVAPEKITVVHNGINPDMFHEEIDGSAIRSKFGFGASDIVLGFTGFIRPWHGLDKIIRALGREPTLGETHLLIVGEGPARADLEALTAELSLQDRVKFAGLVGRRDIPAYVAAFDIALMPSATPYASPLKLFEYLAMGLPTIAPAQPNIEEVLTDGQTGRLFHNQEEMVAAICELSAAPERRQAMRQAARERLTSRGYLWLENARVILDTLGTSQMSPEAEA